MPSSPIAELERKRRRAIKAGVFTSLVVASAFLLGMLIQGCHSQRSTDTQPGLNSPAPETTAPTNPPAIVERSPDTNPPPQFVQPTAAIPNEPPPQSEVFEKSKPDATLYTVKRGDTLTRIARAHGTTVRLLKAENNLKSDQISVGKQLKIPTAMKTVDAPR